MRKPSNGPSPVVEDADEVLERADADREHDERDEGEQAGCYPLARRLESDRDHRDDDEDERRPAEERSVRVLRRQPAEQRDGRRRGRRTRRRREGTRSSTSARVRRPSPGIFTTRSDGAISDDEDARHLVRALAGTSACRPRRTMPPPRSTEANHSRRMPRLLECRRRAPGAAASGRTPRATSPTQASTMGRSREPRTRRDQARTTAPHSGLPGSQPRPPRPSRADPSRGRPRSGRAVRFAPSSCRQERRSTTEMPGSSESRLRLVPAFRALRRAEAAPRPRSQARPRPRSALGVPGAARRPAQAGGLDDRTPLGDSEHRAEHDRAGDSRCHLGVTSDERRAHLGQGRVGAGEEVSDRALRRCPAARARRQETTAAAHRRRRRRSRSRPPTAERRPPP